MATILLFLSLLSLTFFFSQNTFMRQFKGILFIPLALGMGYIAAPRIGIFGLLPSTLENLMPAVRCAITWVAFLAGVRVTIPSRFGRQEAQRLLLHLLLLLVSVGLTWALLEYGQLTDRKTPILPLSLLVGALFCGSSLISFFPDAVEDRSLFHLDNLLAVALISFIVGWVPIPGEHLGVHPTLPFLAAALILSLICFLVLPKQTEFTTYHRLALAGLVTLATGLSLGLQTYEALVGFYFGLMSSKLLNKNLSRDIVLKKTDFPFRLILSFFCGMFAEVSPAILLIAFLLAGLRFLNKQLVQTQIDGDKNAWRFSGLSLVIVLSLRLSSLETTLTTLVLSITVFGLIFTDLFYITSRIVGLASKERRS